MSQKHRDECRSHYERNKGYYLERNRRKRFEVTAMLRAVKNKPCADCGQRFPFYVMDFDHRENKKFTIGSSLLAGMSKIIAEIAKCDVVCANCHRERTHGRRYINAG